MNPHMTPAEISGFLERTLLRVQKPARYTGGEWNSVVKDWDRTPQRIALVFPDIYDLGMSNLGLAILYDQINQRPEMLAERVYAPWTDMEAELRGGRRAALQPGDPPRPGRLRHPRLQPALRAALHQRAQHAGPGRPAAARRTAHGRAPAGPRRRQRLLQPRAHVGLLRRHGHRRGGGGDF